MMCRESPTTSSDVERKNGIFMRKCCNVIGEEGGQTHLAVIMRLHKSCIPGGPPIGR